MLFLLPADHHLLHDPTRMNLHMRGMWLAFVVTACFVVLFVGQLRATLDARTRDQARLRGMAERSDRLAALATLAGGAAHELATPLSTIAVVADDLAHRLKGADVDIIDDVPTAVEAMKKGAHFYLQKPATVTEIEAAFGDEPRLLPCDEELPSLARAEWEYLQRALAECQGNISEAARRLGLHRRSLQRKLQKYPPAR